MKALITELKYQFCCRLPIMSILQLEQGSKLRNYFQSAKFRCTSWRNKPHLVVTVQAGLGKYISQHRAGLVKYSN